MKDKAVMDHLLGDAGITALIGDRCQTGWLKPKTTYPAITCTFEGENPQNTFTDTTDGNEKIAVNIWATSRNDINDLVGLVKTRMSGFGVRLAIIDLGESESGLYRYVIEYSIW